MQYGPGTDDTSVVLIASDNDEDDQPALRPSEATMLRLLEEAEEPFTYGEWVKAGIEAGL